jgi:transcriptional regulator with XRE-family HTH domain
MEVIIEKQFREIVAERLPQIPMTRSELARRVGITPQQMTDILNGHRNPSPERMEVILREMGLEPDLQVRELAPKKKSKAGA